MIALVAVALITIAVYLTGRPAEEVVERLPGVQGESVERHEWAALVALIAIEALGLLAVFGLVASRGQGVLPGWTLPTLFVAGLVVAAWVGWTANLGGRISHPETRPDFSVPLELQRE